MLKGKREKMKTVQPIRTKSKIKDIQEDLKNSNPKAYTLFVVGINTGLRISDLLGLTWESLQEDDSYIFVNIQEKKTGKSKRIRFNGKVRIALKNLREKYPEDIYVFQTESNNSKANSKSWSRVHAYNLISSVAKKHGINENIGTHTMRKTFGYHAYKSGVSLSLLQKIFNHSSQAVTLDYIGITQDDIDSVYMDLDL